MLVWSKYVKYAAENAIFHASLETRVQKRKYIVFHLIWPDKVTEQKASVVGCLNHLPSQDDFKLPIGDFCLYILSFGISVKNQTDDCRSHSLNRWRSVWCSLWNTGGSKWFIRIVLQRSRNWTPTSTLASRCVIYSLRRGDKWGSCRQKPCCKKFLILGYVFRITSHVDDFSYRGKDNQFHSESGNSTRASKNTCDLQLDSTSLLSTDKPYAGKSYILICWAMLLVAVQSAT